MTYAEFASAPNLTAAAAAQNLTWAPVSLTSLTVDSYTLAMNTSDSALLTLSLNADLGVSGDLADVATSTSSSRRRSLLQTSTSMPTASCLAADLMERSAWSISWLACANTL